MFIPHTKNEREAMLRQIGIDNIEDLFSAIPENVRFPKLDLPKKMTEMEVKDYLSEISEANGSCKELLCFLGAGVYDHYSPSVVDNLLRRGEFFTAYTPYQPEISQGTLQAIFEFQTLISNLTSMDVSNASHYDGATATAEACLTAYHSFRGKRKKIILSKSIHPHYRSTVKTYLKGIEDIELVEYEFNDFEAFSATKPENILDKNTALVIFQYPDFFGRIFDFRESINLIHEYGALVAMVVNPMSLGILTPPGELGADIAVGEGQPIGIPLSFGGPYLGFFAVKKNLIRKVSGRLVGETQDKEGNRGYVLTLTAREQHIRREKSTSNICTNQGLMALAVTIYLCTLGKNGFSKVSNLCYQNAHYAANQIESLPGFSVVNKSQFYNEFLVKCPRSVDKINAHLLDHGILGGFAVEQDYPGLINCILLAFTEKTDKQAIDYLIDTLKEAPHA